MMQRLVQRILSYRDLLLRFAVGIVIGLLLLSVGLALFSPILEIREVRVARTDLRLNDELIQQSLRMIFGRHLVLLGAQEIAPLLTQDIPAQSRSAVPDLASVRMTKLYPSALQLRLTLKPVAYRLRVTIKDQNSVPVAGSGADFLTDDGLYVTYPASRIASGSSLPLLTIVDWGVRPTPWKPLLPRAFLQDLHDAEAALSKDFQLSIRSRTVYLRAREFHLQTPSYALWFDTTSPLTQQLQRYRVFLESTPPGAVKQYVDLRLTNAIVYQ